ncbi:hypothetical protein BH10PSE6_BH10PSE6_46250 [soil metagenome]
MRIQSSHDHASRGLDAYFSPPEAVHSLLRIEAGHLPRCIWEPAAGDGAIVRPLRKAGYKVVASDIADYGLAGCDAGVDYLQAPPRKGVEGIVTNPPYKLATRFAGKAVGEVPYLALLLRTNFLESTSRLPFFQRHQPARLWISSRRLPMMHRHGWQGPRAPSNTCFAWFIWDSRSTEKCTLGWFDWRDDEPLRTPDLFGDRSMQADQQGVPEQSGALTRSA